MKRQKAQQADARDERATALQDAIDEVFDEVFHCLGENYGGGPRPLSPYQRTVLKTVKAVASGFIGFAGPEAFEQMKAEIEKEAAD